MATGLMRSKYFSAPFSVHFYVTEKCNFQCRMCNIWRRTSKEMTITEIEQCAKILKELKVPNIVVTGGEPFLRPDIVDIVSVLHRYGFSVRIQTNGTLVTEEKIKALAEAGLRDITISLDTLDEKKFDWICRSENVVQKVKKCLDIVTEYLDGFIVVSTVVSRINISELPEIIQFVNSKGAYASICPVNLLPAENKSSFCLGYSTEMQFSEEDLPEIEKAYADIFRMKKEGYRMVSSTEFLKSSLDCFRTGNASWHCKAGERFFVVYPDGGVSPCDVFPPVFNIKTDFLKKLWHTRYKEKFQQMRGECNGCVIACWRETNLFIDNFATQMEQMRVYFRKKTGTHHQ